VFYKGDPLGIAVPGGSQKRPINKESHVRQLELSLDNCCSPGIEASNTGFGTVILLIIPS
jgi:hypothetical protein